MDFTSSPPGPPHQGLDDLDVAYLLIFGTHPDLPELEQDPLAGARSLLEVNHLLQRPPNDLRVSLEQRPQVLDGSIGQPRDTT